VNFLLDTNICIYIIKQKPAKVLEKFQRLNPSDVGISSITLAELEYGIATSISSAWGKGHGITVSLPSSAFFLFCC
jgi:tRNA(fMet)-specific endonuclease VapC